MATPDELDVLATRLDQRPLTFDTSTSPGAEDRPLPFVLRRCLTWVDLYDMPGEGDGQLRYWQRAGLTGNVAMTSDGRDVHFSDLEVS